MHKVKSIPFSRRSVLTAALAALAFATLPAQFVQANENVNWPAAIEKLEALGLTAMSVTTTDFEADLKRNA